MKAPVFRSLLFALCLAAPAHAYAAYGDDNPFVEAMLRMMAMFGIIDRYPSSLGIPYAPGAGTWGAAGAYPGAAMLPGMSPFGPWGGMGGGIPGMAPLAGAGGWPGMPGSYMTPGSTWPGYAQRGNKVDDLDGIWELDNGSFVIIKGRLARLFLSRDRSQDFTIGYDGRTFWWSPRGGNTTTRYRYQFRDGRMILRDHDGKVLLMRRRS